MTYAELMDKICTVPEDRTEMFKKLRELAGDMALAPGDALDIALRNGYTPQELWDRIKQTPATDTPIKTYQRAIGNAAARFDRGVMNAHVKHMADGDDEGYTVAVAMAATALNQTLVAASRGYGHDKYEGFVAGTVSLF